MKPGDIVQALVRINLQTADITPGTMGVVTWADDVRDEAGIAWHGIGLRYMPDCEDAVRVMSGVVVVDVDHEEGVA